MINITKEKLLKATIAGVLSTITIGFLTLLTYKTTMGLFLAASFGSSMVLLYGFPESPFAQPKNIFFGHFITALIGILFVNYVDLPIFINIALAVGFGIFFMIVLDVVHPPAGNTHSAVAKLSHLDTRTILSHVPLSLRNCYQFSRLFGGDFDPEVLRNL